RRRQLVVAKPRASRQTPSPSPRSGTGWPQCGVTSRCSCAGRRRTRNPSCGAGCGLLFLCYQTSIKDQFGALNSDWMNRVNGPEGGTGRHLLVGQGSGATRPRTANRDAAAAEGATPIVTLAEWVVPDRRGLLLLALGE